MTHPTRRLPLLAALLLIVSLCASDARADTREALVQLGPALAAGKAPKAGGASLYQPTLLAMLYQRRDYRPLWPKKDDVRALLQVIDGAVDDGLLPEDYHRTALAALADKGRSDAQQAALLDVLATDAMARLAIHLHNGKTDPRAFDTNWNISPPVTQGDLLKLVENVAASADIPAAIRDQAPHHWFYAQLKKALAAQRTYVAEGGWGTVESGETLKPGTSSPRVAGLRARLAASGDYTGAAPADDPQLYDDALVDAVKHFQEVHGIDPDGAVGRRTVAELNVTAQQRVDQVRLNLERARWVLNHLGNEFIVVNIPGFHLYVMKDGAPVWNARVVVGKTYRQTAMFKSNMRTVVLNPTWTVPPTILKEDLLPKIAKDPSYLPSHNMSVVDAGGAVVDPASIDWRQARRRFPYNLVQGPGPDNALGQVKFLFPNEHSIYLHDTPHKEGFSRADRAGSSGCIRVENPMELAYYLLDGDKDWPRERIDQTVAAGKTINIIMKRQVPVVIMYWTAQMDRDGTMRFFPDLYNRDAPLLRALGTERRAQDKAD